MNIWNFIKTEIDNNNSVYLMVVIQSNGSSPGRQGFSMAVSSDDSLFGSIGGGAMEYRLVEECKSLLKNNQRQIFTRKQIHKGNVNEGSGMICSGEQTVAFIPFSLPDLPVLSQIELCISKNNTGKFTLTPAGYSFEESDNTSIPQYSYLLSNENDWKYSEIVGFRNTLYVIGAGHVGFAVSKLFAQLNFKVIVIDNRPNLGMLTNNDYTDEKLIINYKDVSDYISESDNSYVVIMTNNHTHDQEVLSLLIRKKVKYIGLMGSKEKVAGLKKAMRKMDFNNDELNRVHSPIGVSINSKTPDEIAISIAAEIISIKNK